MIQNVLFTPINKKPDGLIGYVNFSWNDDFRFKDIGVYELRASKGTIRIRLRYDDRSVPKNGTYDEIVEEVNSYIIAQYPESLQ